MTKPDSVDYAAAQALVRVTTKLGYPCAFYGDFARTLYGYDRGHTNIEALLLKLTTTPQPPTIDALKRLIAYTEPTHFFARIQGKSIRLEYLSSKAETKPREFLSIELHYLDVPSFVPIRNVGGLPVAPLEYLILRQLLKWNATRVVLKSLPSQASHAINFMLALSLSTPQDEGPLDMALHYSSRSAIYAYLAEFPSSAGSWKHLGFDTAPGAPKAVTPIPRRLEVTQETGSKVDLENPTRVQMICLAGKTVVDILRLLKFPCAIFGSLACFICFITDHALKDVDILALPSVGDNRTIEQLKLSIVRANPTNFFLIPARDPAATYQILYYRLTNSLIAQTPRTSCKVDIVFPGTLHLPKLPLTKIWWDDALPLIPFSLLLLQKLQGWDDHGLSHDELKRLKQPIDAQDVQGLLKLSMCVGLRYTQPWKDRQLFSVEFERFSRERVNAFCGMYGDQDLDDWVSLGFDIVRPGQTGSCITA